MRETCDACKVFFRHLLRFLCILQKAIMHPCIEAKPQCMFLGKHLQYVKTSFEGSQLNATVSGTGKQTKMALGED